MKEKSQIEKKAEEKQTELLSAALGGASNAGGHWLNVSGKDVYKRQPAGHHRLHEHEQSVYRDGNGTGIGLHAPE